MQTWSYGHWGLLLGVSTWLNLITLMWFTYKNLDFLEDCLSDCRCVSDTRTIWQGGVVGRHMRLNMVFMVTYMPGFFFRRGDITKDAQLNIPHHLKWWIWCLHGWLVTNGGAMAVLCYLIKDAR